MSYVNTIIMIATFHSRLCTRGGGSLGPKQFWVGPIKVFRRNFGTKTCRPIMHLISGLDIQKNVSFQNGGQNKNRFAKIVTWPKFEKPLKKMSQSWRNKIQKKYEWRLKQVLLHCAMMLIQKWKWHTRYLVRFFVFLFYFFLRDPLARWQ